MSTQGQGNSRINIKKYIVYLLIFITISFLTLYYIYRLFGEPSSILIFTNFKVSLIITLLILLILYFVLDGLRLYYVLKSLNIQIKFRHIFKLVFINIFISNITPLATGGGFAQVYFLNKKGVPVGNALAATTIRTVLASFFIFLSAPIILLSNEYMLSIFSRAPIFLYFFIFAVIYIAFFYIAIFKNKFVQKIIYLFFRFLHKINLVSRKKYRRIVKYSFEHIELFSKDLALFLKGNPWYVILSILFTLLFLLAEFSFAILIMSGMGYQVNYLSVILMQFVVVFFMYFAPTPGATGVAEGGFSLLFAQFVDKKDIFPLIFSWRLFTKYIGIGIGIVLFLILLFKGDRDHEEN